VIEEVAVFGQGEKLGPLKNLAISSVSTDRKRRIRPHPDVRIPTQAAGDTDLKPARVRFDAGHRSEMKRAT